MVMTQMSSKQMSIVVQWADDMAVCMCKVLAK